jgi:hypothetical protein
VREGVVGAWSYVWLYTIEANGTSGNPVAPPPMPPAGHARYRVGESLTEDSGTYST